MSFTKDDLKTLQDLRDDLECVLDKLDYSIDEFRDLDKKVAELTDKELQIEFTRFIAAGFIPGTVFKKEGDPDRSYQIVSIGHRHYIAIELGKPEQTYKMPLTNWRTGESLLNKYTFSFVGDPRKVLPKIPDYKEVFAPAESEQENEH